MAALHLRRSPTGTASRRPAIRFQIPGNVRNAVALAMPVSPEKEKRKRPLQAKRDLGLFSDRNHTVETPHLWGFASPMGEKAFSGNVRGEGAGFAPAALAQPPCQSATPLPSDRLGFC